MDQQRKIKIQQQQARRLAARRKAKLAAQQAAAATPTAPPPKRQVPKVANPLPKPNINADDWNKECFVVGGGPSLIGFDWSNLDGKFAIAINRAYEVLPGAQIVYFTDNDYWERHKGPMKEHKGKLFRGRIARNPDIVDPDVTECQLQPQPSGWSDTFGELYHGSNSTYACIQLAAQLGFNTIYLLGVDMQHRGLYNKKKKNNHGVTHWHNGHRRTDPSTAYKMMMGHYSRMVPLAAKRKINIININTPKGTAMKFFPIKTVDEVFGI